MENEAYDLGNIELIPIKFVGQVRGRLIDAQDESPLYGSGPPWAFVILQRCDESDCWYVAGLQPDELGNFLADGILNQLSPGTYMFN